MIKLSSKFDQSNDVTLYLGDCFDLIKTIPDNSVKLIVTSPPYAMGKDYERPKDNIATFISQHIRLLPELIRVLQPGGSLCWQVGYHIKNGIYTPLDFLIYDIVQNMNKTQLDDDKLYLQNRIIWTFGHGLMPKKRFSGRHETILWFTKGMDYELDQDALREPQKYPGKKNKNGEYTGNPLGKALSDVWDIPNVKANHIEKTEHPCQFPVAIPQRLIKMLTKPGEIVLDPFNGSGATGIAAMIEGRKYVGADIMEKYIEISKESIIKASKGEAKYREDKPVYQPTGKNAVERKPEHFKW